MYFRLTKTTWDPSRRDEMYSYADGLRERMKTLNAQSIRVVEVDEGTTFMIAIYDSKESADKAKPHAQEILGGMAEFITAPPDPCEGEMTWEM